MSFLNFLVKVGCHALCTFLLQDAWAFPRLIRRTNGTGWC